MACGVVCLHGFLGAPSSFDAITALVAATGKPYLFNAPLIAGHAPAYRESAPLFGGFCEEVARLAELIRQTHEAPVTLVGYSMGGRLALAIAIEYPKIVGRLILVSARRGLDSEREREERRRSDERWARLLETDGLPEFLRQWDAQPLFASRRGLPKDQREQQRRLTLRPEGLAWSLRHLGLGSQPSYEQEVEGLSLPVTLVTGSLDDKFCGLSRALAAKLPNCQRVMVEGHGHALLLEARAAIAQIIVKE